MATTSGNGVIRMTDVEALMWSLEADPHLSSTFANLSVFDREPDHDRLRRRMWRASRVVPRLRQRVVDGPGPLTPTWEDDPDFDLDHHVRHVTLPTGSTLADARALAAELARRPFDRSRPLWEFTVVTGLADATAAMVQKLHHTITDGEGGIRMSVEFIDTDRDAPEPPPIDDGPPPAPAPSRSLLGGAPGVLGDLARRNVDVARGLTGSAVDLLRDPVALASTVAQLPAESVATARSLIRQLGIIDASRSPLWTRRSLERSFHTFEVPLADVKATAERLGGSVNDVFVTAAAGGAGRYHRDRGRPVDELRMSMPVSTRTSRAPGGNAFTPTRVLVPTNADPRERFAAIHERLGVTKTEKALGATASVASLAKLVPTPIVVRIARQQVMTVDFTTSNVRAAPFDLYIAGARMEANFPLGPIAGTAWNLTTMSYRGVLDIGLHTDTRAVAEPDDLARAIEDEFTDLVALGRAKPRRRTAG